MPARSGHAHSEDLPWLEVPHPVPAAEEESDSGVSLVPPIRGEAPCFCRNALKTTHKAKKKNRIMHSVFLSSYLFFIFFSISQQQKKYQRIKSATTLVQSYTRGWQVRTFM